MTPTVTPTVTPAVTPAVTPTLTLRSCQHPLACSISLCKEQSTNVDRGSLSRTSSMTECILPLRPGQYISMNFLKLPWTFFDYFIDPSPSSTKERYWTHSCLWCYTQINNGRVSVESWDPTPFPMTVTLTDLQWVGMLGFLFDLYFSLGGHYLSKEHYI